MSFSYLALIYKNKRAYHYPYHIVQKAVSRNCEYHKLALTSYMEREYSPNCILLCAIGGTHGFEIVRSHKILCGFIKLFFVYWKPTAVGCIFIKRIFYLAVMYNILILLAAAHISCVKIKGDFFALQH